MKPLAGKLEVPGYLAALGGKPSEPQSDVLADHGATSDHSLKKDVRSNTTSSLADTSDDESVEKIDTNAEHGVQAVQAMTYAWSKTEIIFLYIIIWLISFLLAFSNGIINTLTPYVTSSFQEHSLTALTSVISSLVAGIWKLPYAKIMNVWGRPHAFAISVAFMTMGLIMMAGCKNVQTYCAAQVFYWMGYNGIDFSITVCIADTSKLKNRGFMIGYSSSPFLITTWVYGYAADSVINGMGYHWGFGIFCILVPIVMAPFGIMHWIAQEKARKAGLIPPRATGNMTLAQKTRHYLKEFDVIGLLILATGLALFLLAFNIYSYQPDTWRSPLIICFLIFGGLLVIAFAVWEAKFAPITFVPWELLKNRTVIFTYTMAASLYTAWYIWDNYFYSLLIVLFNQTVVHATYISNIYTMGSCFICLVYGLCLRYISGRLKLYSLFWGVPLTILGVGLMIKFRQPDVNIGYIVMCQIFVAFGGGVLVTSEQTTLMAVSKQRDFPALLACESMVIAIGSAIGSTIAGAMWTGIFPKKLLKYLPASAQGNFANIYGDLTVQASYPLGSPTRDAINRSYAETQRYMLIAATSLYTITLVSVGLWQDVDVRTMKQRTVGLL
ncbi:MFS transporter, SIT family, siderophore-iron:H+ symporter [Fonsecaea erecta]|uniref:MFS transporter, SIT family, siderophore-iron:H+ symporter n=1 Tax=Fonsecaea erecta TaxID=1367422 RepID=A0A178ZM88_9EURO|nr:MFS transporter, SIT family, siderophore-iron:H+ symporter [Fonsecaea erecta]OAP60323.1 MFS transporter, SIT family, siderophore-iron:H+ symporter [Fonsecaea erecta]